MANPYIGVDTSVGFYNTQTQNNIQVNSTFNPYIETVDQKPNVNLTTGEQLFGVTQETDNNAVIGVASNPFLSQADPNLTDLNHAYVQQMGDPTNNAGQNLNRLLSVYETNF